MNYWRYIFLGNRIRILPGRSALAHFILNSLRSYFLSASLRLTLFIVNLVVMSGAAILSVSWVSVFPFFHPIICSVWEQVNMFVFSKPISVAYCDSSHQQEAHTPQQ